MIAFAAALEKGAGIECDLRLTADDQIVVFHDSDAMRICGSPMRIAKSSWRELSRLSVGEHPMSTLESLLALVDGRVPLLLEVKVENDIWRWSRALKAALSDYRGAFGIMSFDARVPKFLKTEFPGVRRGLVIRDDLSALKRRAALWFAQAEFLAVDLAALGKPWVDRERGRTPVYSWTIRTAEQRAQAAVHVDALIWEADGRP